ncbi:methyltransferase family protein [Streptomyces sp. NRRL S-118]|uniref:methyltransferase family protein n=1 Tax=Streptomyces sp. NRRL S-118 TaxID=1463881 RepID=UPI00069451CE|nr:isoprenylcysteine carboxylmethyltransferase family protein [Streptomyces sp. NRRL S-118]
MSKAALVWTLAGATAALEYGLEARWALRRRRTDRRRPPQPLAADRRSTYVLFGAIALGEAGAAVLLRRAPSARMTGDRATSTLIALPGVWAGMALRHWAVATLGEYFRGTVDVRPGQPVIRTGPYRHLRHPSYAGGLLMVACAGFALDHPRAHLVFFGCTLAGMLHRIRAEDVVLISALGPRYAEYAARTARLVPGVW